MVQPHYDTWFMQRGAAVATWEGGTQSHVFAACWFSRRLLGKVLHSDSGSEADLTLGRGCDERGALDLTQGCAFPPLLISCSRGPIAFNSLSLFSV